MPDAGSRCLRARPPYGIGRVDSLRCIECPPQPPPPPGVAPPRSAWQVGQREGRHEQLAATHEEAIADRWGTSAIAKVARAISVEPQSTRAWAIGAAGEEKLAAELDKVRGLRLLHDRRIPGTRGNIDHIVIGPAGVFVVDAKNHQGSIRIRDRGGLFAPTCASRLPAETCRMRWMASCGRSTSLCRRWTTPTSLVDLGYTRPCFLRVEWPLLRPPKEFRGVRLESHRSIKRLVTRPTVLMEAGRLRAGYARPQRSRLGRPRESSFRSVTMRLAESHRETCNSRHACLRAIPLREAEPRARCRFIDGYRNIFNATRWPDWPGLANAGRVQLDHGIDSVKKVNGVDGERRPAILIASKPHRAGSDWTPWHDELDAERGHVRYFGDNKAELGFDPLGPPGNRSVIEQFGLHSSASRSDRLRAAPLLIFESLVHEGRAKGFWRFLGVGTVERADSWPRSIERAGLSSTTSSTACSSI